MTKRGATATSYALWALLGATMAVACSTSVAVLGGADNHSTPEGADGTFKKSDKLDLLLVVDNSISISPQRQNLEKAIPDFVQHLLDEQPSLSDVHVGLITTSLGSRGADSCRTDEFTERGEASDDKGALIGSRPRFAAAAARHPGALPTTPQGFVSWSSGASKAALAESVTTMVDAAGWQGCDWESPLEAMYRFLNDPRPPLTIELGPCPSAPSVQCSRKSGIDDALLAQRAAFLRPDSVVAVAMFTDENDCSIVDEGQGFVLASTEMTLSRGSGACEANPNDPCCYPCTGPKPAQCPADPVCNVPWADGVRAEPAFRCIDQKRKFGVDFLYPVERYTNALSKKTLCSAPPGFGRSANCQDAVDADGGRVAFENPLFSGTGADARDPSMVYLLGVVGVPRADLLTDSGDAYRTAAELEQSGTWDAILGTPRPPSEAAPIPPTNALMLESRAPRAGNDGQGVALARPTAEAFANPQNGHEHQDSSDLQAACIVPLAEPIDCKGAIVLQDPRPGCSCEDSPASYLLPACQNPETNGYEFTQRFDQVYPNPRQLELLQSLGDNGVTTSLCSPNFSDTSRADFGYREAAAALAAQMKRSLR